MTPTEQLLRETYADIGERAPDSSPVLARIMVGARIRRRRRRHLDIGLAVGVVVVAVAVPLAIWPHHTKPRYTTVQTPPTTVAMDITPTWLPPGVVETERRYDPGGYKVDDNPDPVGPRVIRVFRSATAKVTIVDGALPVTVTTRPVTVDGRNGVGVGTNTGSAFRLQVPWRSGRLLDVAVQGIPSARAATIRIAESVRSEPTVNLDLPLTCTDPLCGPHLGLDVHGTAQNWTATTGGLWVSLDIVHGVITEPDNAAAEHVTVNGRAAMVWQSGMRRSSTLIMPIGGGRQLRINSNSRRPLSREEAVRLARSIQLNAKADYSWLGTRPG